MSKMFFNNTETTYSYNGTEFYTLEETIMYALDIVQKRHKIYMCSVCGATKVMPITHEGIIECENCKKYGD